METLLQEVGEHLIFVMIAACFVVGMVLKSVTSVITNGARERSRREIAAYIAEGSMSAEQGERLISADVNGRRPPGV